MPRLDGKARRAQIIERIKRIPPGSVRAYGDIDPEAPRLVGRVLSTTHEELPWFRVVHSDGTIPKGDRQKDLLAREGVPMRGDRVDIKLARLPAASRRSKNGPSRNLRSGRSPLKRRPRSPRA